MRVFISLMDAAGPPHDNFRDRHETERAGTRSVPMHFCRRELWQRALLLGTLEGPTLEHDPEKWEPVFAKDHAQTKG
jgi:hypothetical protein